MRQPSKGKKKGREVLQLMKALTKDDPREKQYPAERQKASEEVLRKILQVLDNWAVET